MEMVKVSTNVLGIVVCIDRSMHDAIGKIHA